ncbi:MAG: ribonuclease J [Synergistota bacterium]|nr:ribonuclease J [Synergistota bacterium]HHV52196.1 ribonuclease J [Synergistaceae bacterium]
MPITSGQRNKKTKRGRKELRFIPLGGMGEIGKNISLLEYGNDILVIDSGLKFPDEDMLGIDFVIPDFSYLLENKNKIRGLILTHGHEDHIGSLPFLLPQIDVPIYGTRLTLGLVNHKFQELKPDYTIKANEVHAGEVVRLGCFNVHFMSTCHSIPDSLGLAIETPVGNIIHSGDFKFDPTPLDARPPDYSTLVKFGHKGVLLLLSDSTNAEEPGYTPSERGVGQTLEGIFRLHQNKRIVLSMFASNLHRINQVIQTALRFNRKVALIGRSMNANVELARQLGYIDVDDSAFVPPQALEGMRYNRVAVLTTGSQGEPFSGLVLMSKGEHKYIKLGPKDLVVISALPIPGNEKLVSRTIDNLFRKGCEVIYEGDRQTHVSGHASQEELKMMLSMVKPRYFVPIHGEYRHLVRHAQLAHELGMEPRDVFVLENGDVLSFNQERARIKDPVRAGAFLIDGTSMGEIEGSILQERRLLAEDGIIAVSVTVDENMSLCAPPLIESRGFLHQDEAGELYKRLENAIAAFIKRAKGECPEAISQAIVTAVRRELKHLSKSLPVVLPSVTVLQSRSGLAESHWESKAS